MTALAVASLLLLLWVSLLYVPFRWRPVGIYLWTEKVFAAAYTPWIVAVGALLALAGARLGSWWIAVPAGMAALGALVVILRIGAVRPDLSRALGVGRTDHAPAQRRARMIGRFWTGRLPSSPEPRARRDVPFASIPGTERVLLCDVWQPSAGVTPSGVALVYVHGSAYGVLDKDLGTRPLFRHLAGQGHVIVDVAHRLFPETDPVGMVGDVKRAVAWVRSHTADLGVDPARVIVAGGSSGGHLALLAAYGHDALALTPPELAGCDLRVAGVVSLYGQVGLETLYHHTSQDKICHPDDPQPDWNAKPSAALVRFFGADAARLRLQFIAHAGRCDWLMGGTPSEVPERYALVSALSYVHSGCPPTLLVHGTHDEMAPVSAVRHLQQRLEEVGVPVTAVYLPHTDHAFDVIGTRWSPSARVAIHVLERFLAGMSEVRSTTPSTLDPLSPFRPSTPSAASQVR